jgi:hypothetical protein
MVVGRVFLGGLTVLRAFHKGSAVRNAALIKRLSAVACAVLPLFLTAYSGLAKNHYLAISAEDMGLVVAFLVGAIGAISTVITSPLVGLPAEPKQRGLE